MSNSYSKLLCIKIVHLMEANDEDVSISCYFVYWVDLTGINDPNESIDGFSLELLKVSTDKDNSPVEKLPVAMTKSSKFRINRYHKARTQNTIGIVFAIEDILPGMVKVLGESHYRYLEFDEFRQTGQTILKVKELLDISECQAVFVYVSSIEVEYIHFMLQHPFTFGDVVRIYRHSKKCLVTQSLLYQVLRMFQSLDLELPLVFCVKAQLEPTSHQTIIGTAGVNEDCESCHSDI